MLASVRYDHSQIEILENISDYRVTLFNQRRRLIKMSYWGVDPDLRAVTLSKCLICALNKDGSFFMLFLYSVSI